MKLKDELGLKQDLSNRAHEGLLGIYFTGDLLRKRAREFFSAYGITDVQFNLMELLFYQSKKKEGLTQAELSRMMLVNRSNVTALLDRMEKTGLVRRNQVPGDRRINSVTLTPKGGKVLLDVEKKYMEEVEAIMGVLSKKELEELTAALGRVREKLYRKRR
jgi:DNA-binding MarR family transcriptional regulator